MSFNSLHEHLRKQTELGRVLALNYPQMVGRDHWWVREQLKSKGRGYVSDLAISEMLKVLKRGDYGNQGLQGVSPEIRGIQAEGER